MDALQTPRMESEQDAAPTAAPSKQRRTKADGGLPRFGWKLMVIATTVAAVGIALVAGTTAHGYQEVPVGHASEQGPAAQRDLVVQTDVRQGEIDPDGQDYLACMRGAGGTADSLVRWVDVCREHAASVATGEIQYVACMRGAGWTADSLVRWVDVCRERALLA